MRQNKYDDPAFFTKYSQMARSIGGLDAAGEWPAFRELLPELRDKDVLDLGCGFGWHCRYARAQQARSVVGVDLSEKMLARARESTNDSAIEYRQLAIEDIDFSTGTFDVVLSSLALHYVERFDIVCRKVHHCLVPEGIFVFSVELAWLPAGNLFTIGNGSFLDYVHHLIAPSMVLALVTIAIWSRYMRSSMLEVINQDYIRTARAKGLPEWQVLTGHAFRNALLPMITIAGLQLPALLSGALVTETVFTWPGMGRLFLDSIGYRDYPMVMGVLMLSAVLVLLGNLMADLLYAASDPRIRLD